MAYCAGCRSRSNAICRYMDVEETLRFNQIGQLQVLERGQHLAWEGGPSNWVAAIIDGALLLSSTGSDGRRQLLRLAFSSEYVGRPYSNRIDYSVSALTRTEVLLFERTDFEMLLRSSQNLARAVLEHTLDELDDTYASVYLLGRADASQRIASFLLDMDRKLARPTAHPERSSGEPTIWLPMDRQGMAELLGLTLETISRRLAQMGREGIINISKRRQVTILDRPALSSIAQGAIAIAGQASQD